ncbi:hypothetical protein WJX73_000236 [Symbiochloris irregularis]|uniref:Guanine nucleotide-binding protein subunit beta-like protein n=1 Tax=Symbiochloris irregularis TaxID=706552 RepID=A0AAW1Q251_9CHLO
MSDEHEEEPALQEPASVRAPRISQEDRSALLAQQALLEQQANALGIYSDSEQPTRERRSSVSRLHSHPGDSSAETASPEVFDTDNFNTGVLELSPVQERTEEALSFSDAELQESFVAGSTVGRRSSTVGRRSSDVHSQPAPVFPARHSQEFSDGNELTISEQRYDFSARHSIAESNVAARYTGDSLASDFGARYTADSLAQSSSGPYSDVLQDDGDFAVDTDIVMAYNDDSVRHFLQAMEMHDTLDTFEKEWQDKIHNPEGAAAQRRSSSLDGFRNPDGSVAASRRSSVAQEAPQPTPRTAQITSLQSQLEAAQQALAEARLQVAEKEQAEQDVLAATQSAQQMAAQAVADAEAATDAAREQAAEALQHARTAASLAERNGRELQTLQAQRQMLQEQVEDAQASLQRQIDAEAAAAEAAAANVATPANNKPVSPPVSKPPSAASRGFKPAFGVSHRASWVAETHPLPAKKSALTPLPTGDPEMLSLQELPPAPVKSWWLLRTMTAHSKAIAGVAAHPSKPIAVTASDDHTWQMWHLPSGERILSGEGHAGWVAGVAFHPKGTYLASASGDACVKLWSFASQKCVATYKGHTQAVWGVAWHSEGNFLASCSLDHSMRIWDFSNGKSRQILRGHTDSVNEVGWQEGSGNLCSASADKTVCVWDARSGMPTLKLLGHEASCNCATFNQEGNLVASGDANGVVRLWDLRKMAELLTLPLTPAGKAVNSCRFDHSGKVLIAASDSGKVECLDVGTGAKIKELEGHAGPVHDVAMTADGLLSAGADGTLRIWGKNE